MHTQRFTAAGHQKHDRVDSSALVDAWRGPPKYNSDVARPYSSTTKHVAHVDWPRHGCSASMLLHPKMGGAAASRT